MASKNNTNTMQPLSTLARKKQQHAPNAMSSEEAKVMSELQDIEKTLNKMETQVHVLPANTTEFFKDGSFESTNFTSHSSLSKVDGSPTASPYQQRVSIGHKQMDPSQIAAKKEAIRSTSKIPTLSAKRIPVESPADNVAALRVHYQKKLEQEHQRFEELLAENNTKWGTKMLDLEQRIMANINESNRLNAQEQFAAKLKVLATDRDKYKNMYTETIQRADRDSKTLQKLHGEITEVRIKHQKAMAALSSQLQSIQSENIELRARLAEALKSTDYMTRLREHETVGLAASKIPVKNAKQIPTLTADNHTQPPPREIQQQQQKQNGVQLRKPVEHQQKTEQNETKTQQPKEDSRGKHETTLPPMKPMNAKKGITDNNVILVPPEKASPQKPQPTTNKTVAPQEKKQNMNTTTDNPSPILDRSPVVKSVKNGTQPFNQTQQSKAPQDKPLAQTDRQTVSKIPPAVQPVSKLVQNQQTAVLAHPDQEARSNTMKRATLQPTQQPIPQTIIQQIPTTTAKPNLKPNVIKEETVSAKKNPSKPAAVQPPPLVTNEKSDEMSPRSSRKPAGPKLQPHRQQSNVDQPSEELSKFQQMINRKNIKPPVVIPEK